MRLEYGRHGVEPAVTKRPGSGWRPHVDCSEEYPGCEACRRRPGVDSRLHPIRNRRGSDMSTRALQVCDDPEPLGELDVLDLQCCSLRRRRPQPISTATMARFLSCRGPEDLNAPMRRLPSSAVSQLPIRMPRRRAPLTRRIPAARSALSNPQSAAS